MLIAQPDAGLLSPVHAKLRMAGFAETSKVEMQSTS